MAKLISACLGALLLVADSHASYVRSTKHHALAFRCRSPDVKGDIVVLFRGEGRSTAELSIQEKGDSVFALLMRDSHYPGLKLGTPRAFQQFQSTCEVTHLSRHYSIPVDIYHADDAVFAVVDLPVKDQVFSASLEAVTFAQDRKDSYGAFLLVPASHGEKRYVRDAKRTLPLGFRTPAIVREGASWHLVVNEVGFIANSKYTQLNEASDEKIKGYMSTSTRGLLFPTKLYESLVSQFKSVLGGRVTKQDTHSRFLVSDCFLAGSNGRYKMNAGLFEVVVILEGIGGNGVRLSPHTFLERLTDGSNSCWMNIFKDESLGEKEIVLGDAFMHSSDMQFSKDEGFVIAPLSVYSPTHSVDDTMPFQPEPAPLMEIVNRHDFETAGNGLLIGIAVGGSILIIGAIVFLIVRAKRKSRQAFDRFSPSRPMVADPSEGSVISN